MRRRYRAVPHVLMGIAAACGPATIAAPPATTSTTSPEAEPPTSVVVVPETEAAPQPAATGIGPTTIPANSIANGPLPVDVSQTLACIRAHESDTAGGYGAVSGDGTYRGAYQFDARTWASVGGQGDPADASPTEQDQRAAELLARRGTQPWGGVC